MSRVLGIALTDTFQLNESDGAFDSVVFPENSERVQRQKNQDIRVIVMNPPYSAGQTSANDNNQNQSYPVLDASIAETYAKLSTGTNKNSLYDSYIRGIRWASNRIKDDGVIAFVSNGSFIDGNTADGIRKTFATEFSRIFVYNLRGNQRTSGEVSRKEGGKIFGSGARTPIAVTILIKNAAHTGPADIQYRDIGDYLTREQKLDILEIEQSLEGTDWEALTPNEHGDWINHRDENYDSFQPIGDKGSKGTTATTALFSNYSRGLETGRDSWTFNYSKNALIGHVKTMVAFYNSEVDRLAGTAAEDLPGLTNNDPRQISWTRSLMQDLARGKQHGFSESRAVASIYRPFSRQWAYFDRSMNAYVNQIPRMFPTPAQENISIMMPQGSSAAAFSVIATRHIPALTPNGGNQCFSLYVYEPISSDAQGDLFTEVEDIVIDGYRRRDNITDATLATYRSFYEDVQIGKEDIFFYVYALLHSPTYKEQYKADLMKMLPRIPKVKDFWGYSQAGRALAELHLDYETVTPYPLEEITKGAPGGDEYDFYRVNKLSFGARKDRSRIIYNPRITLAGIPDEAFEYQVNGKSALEWILDRYQVTTHKDSQITNDPNDYCREIGNPRYIVDLIKRIVTVSVDTMKIVALLPALEIVE